MKLDYRIGEYDTSSAILDELSYNMEIYFVKVKMARLREGHPLALQVNLRSGVANGVLIVRNSQNCAKLRDGIHHQG